MAHVILLGLLKDFWAQWLPRPKKDDEAKVRRTAAQSKYMLPPYIVRELSRRAGNFPSVKSISKHYRDIVR